MIDSFNLEKSLQELAESKELLKSVSDIDVAKHIVDAICDETGLDKWKVKVAYKVIALPLVSMASGMGKLISDGMKQKMISIAARVPWVEEVVKSIKDKTTKTSQEILATSNAKVYLDQRRPVDQEALEFRKHMSLEFNLALDTFTATQEMRAEFGTSLDLIRDALTGIEGFVNPQPRFKQAIERNQRHRFVYRSNYIPFFGRKAELTELHEFLWSEGLFRWQAIIAPGGAGKSRLAWEFCQRNSIVWRAGFLDNIRDVNFTFSSWKPNQPTLVVLDYASKDREAVKDVLHILACRKDFDCAVRILLLDRESSDDWITEGWHGSDGREVEQSCYNAPLVIDPSLGVAEIIDIVKFFIGIETEMSDVEIQNHIDNISAIDQRKRPLFVAYYADALAREGIGRNWDRNSLIHDVIEREKEKYWKSDGEYFVTKRDEALLALATMVGGITVRYKKLPPQVTSMEELLEHPNRFVALGGYAEEIDDGKVVQIVPAWEPDLVGELFVLNMLRNDEKTNFNALRKPLIEAAWRLDKFAMASFLDRALQDYSSDKAFPGMCFPHGQVDKYLWCLLAVNLIGRLGNAQREKDAEYIYNIFMEYFANLKQDEETYRVFSRATINMIGSCNNTSDIENLLKKYDLISPLIAVDPDDLNYSTMQIGALWNIFNLLSEVDQMRWIRAIYGTVNQNHLNFPNNDSFAAMLTMLGLKSINILCKNKDFYFAMDIANKLVLLLLFFKKSEPIVCNAISGICLLASYLYGDKQNDLAQKYENVFNEFKLQYAGVYSFEDNEALLRNAKSM